MFWRKKSNVDKMSGPKEIPDLVGRRLVTDYNKDPDWVWSLKGVVRPHSENKHIFDVRVFDNAQVSEAKIQIKDYGTFDCCPELVLFEGSFNDESLQVKLTPNKNNKKLK